MGTSTWLGRCVADRFHAIPDGSHDVLHSFERMSLIQEMVSIALVDVVFRRVVDQIIEWARAD
jgi:hypothetical protein